MWIARGVIAFVLVALVSSPSAVDATGVDGDVHPADSAAVPSSTQPSTASAQETTVPTTASPPPGGRADLAVDSLELNGVMFDADVPATHAWSVTNIGAAPSVDVVITGVASGDFLGRAFVMLDPAADTRAECVESQGRPGEFACPSVTLQPGARLIIAARLVDEPFDPRSPYSQTFGVEVESADDANEFNNSVVLASDSFGPPPTTSTTSTTSVPTTTAEADRNLPATGGPFGTRMAFGLVCIGWVILWWARRHARVWTVADGAVLRLKRSDQVRPE